MIPHRFVPHDVRTLLQRQDGVLSLDQASRMQLPRSTISALIRDGHWHRVERGILADTQRLTWQSWLWVAALKAPDAVIGGEAAGHLWGLVPQSDTIEAWTTRQLKDFGCLAFRRGRRVGRGEPARLGLEETTVDLCAAAEGSDDMVALLSKAVSSRRTTTERLRAEVQAREKLPQRRLLLDLLGDVRGGVESALEHRYLVDVERAHGLPVGQRQMSVSRGTRSDVVYRDHRILVELDGRAWHAGLRGSLDLMRDNLHALDDWLTLHFDWRAVTQDPCRVAEMIASALIARGWLGLPKRCRRCQRVSSC